jgi:hypothetical protein
MWPVVRRLVGHWRCHREGGRPGAPNIAATVLAILAAVISDVGEWHLFAVASPYRWVAVKLIRLT